MMPLTSRAGHGRLLLCIAPPEPRKQYRWLALQSASGMFRCKTL
jgi:hypothetical protein